MVLNQWRASGGVGKFSFIIRFWSSICLWYISTTCSSYCMWYDIKIPTRKRILEMEANHSCIAPGLEKGSILKELFFLFLFSLSLSLLSQLLKKKAVMLGSKKWCRSKRRTQQGVRRANHAENFVYELSDLLSFMYWPRHCLRKWQMDAVIDYETAKITPRSARCAFCDDFFFSLKLWEVRILMISLMRYWRALFHSR